jgi:hypothetical protein
VPRDAIPPLDNPPTGLGLAEFTSAVQATYLADLDIVIGVEIDGDARAYPVKILNWHEIVNHTVVLSEQTGYTRDYGGDFYIQVGYTTSAVVWFPQVPSIDSRFHPKTMVLGLIGDQASKAYPFSEMGSEAVINDRFDGVDIVVVFQEKAQAALAFDRAVNGRTLSFVPVR